MPRLSVTLMPRLSVTLTFFFCALLPSSLVSQTSVPLPPQTTPANPQTAPANPLSIGGTQTTSNQPTMISPLTQPTFTPGMITLLQLEERFAKAVAEGGGKAFASWFADDAVTLNNGKPAVIGRAAIAASAYWSAKDYQLTWLPQGAQMSASNDMGFTWGHYEGRSKDSKGEPVVITGRYMTVWRKLPDGTWKVAMDASANEPPPAAECCVVAKP